mmetsp:Transcript_111432/g.279029  ORF Transcript_111432/g.279029 Transcript_111432/m.279029 type:complete len:325 (+) Transcript_111432:355-1329(+)
MGSAMVVLPNCPCMAPLVALQGAAQQGALAELPNSWRRQHWSPSSQAPPCHCQMALQAVATERRLRTTCYQTQAWHLLCCWCLWRMSPWASQTTRPVALAKVVTIRVETAQTRCRPPQRCEPVPHKPCPAQVQAGDRPHAVPPAYRVWSRVPHGRTARRLWSRPRGVQRHRLPPAPLRATVWTLQSHARQQAAAPVQAAVAPPAHSRSASLEMGCTQAKPGQSRPPSVGLRQLQPLLVIRPAQAMPARPEAQAARSDRQEAQRMHKLNHSPRQQGRNRAAPLLQTLQLLPSQSRYPTRKRHAALWERAHKHPRLQMPQIVSHIP